MSVTAQLNKHGCSQMCSAMFVLIENPIVIIFIVYGNFY